MDEEIKKLVGTYFQHFYNLTVKWNVMKDQYDKPLQSLKNQVEQLCSIEKARVEQEFGQFPQVKEKLFFKVLMGIDEEISVLKTLQHELHSDVSDLKSKLMMLEKATKNVNWEDKTKTAGDAFHPPLENLLQYAYTGWRIFDDLNHNILNAFKSLDVHNENSLRALKVTLKEDEERQINEIIAFTQFCYEA